MSKPEIDLARRRAAGRLLAAAGAVAAGGAFTRSAWAQGHWPDKPIRLILPYPPGGPSSIVTRSAAEKMQSAFSQPIVIENKSGAGGNIGTAEVARAAPDGYTWLVAVDTQMTISPHVYTKLNFKVDDLVPQAVLSNFSQILVCNPSLGVKTLREFVQKAKSEKFAYASGGAGVPGHMAMELLCSMAGIELDHIPYKGPGPAAQDVIGGQVPCGFLATPTMLPHIRSGRLVALGVSTKSRSPVLPEVPTIADTYPGYDATFSLVLFSPRGTPQPIVDRFAGAMRDALKAPDVVEVLKKSDQEVVASSQKEAAQEMAVRYKQWGEVARRINLRLD